MLVRANARLLKSMSTTDDDKSASIPVSDSGNACWIGWPALVERLRRAIAERCSSKPILVVECYPGVDGEAILRELQQRLKPKLALHSSTAFHHSQQIEKLIQPFVDESRLRISQNYPLTLSQFFDAERLWHARREIEDLREGLVIIVGCGASLIAWGQVLVYATLTRGEARQRLSQPDGSNLGVENRTRAAEKKHHIASRVDWPVADRWKRPLITHWDFVLEMKRVDAPTLVDGEAVQRGLQLAVQRPFTFASRRSLQNATQPDQADLNDRSSVTPGRSQLKSAWHEESLVLSFGEVQLELPALDLLLAQPQALLGDAAFLRFGFDCPLFQPDQLSVRSYEPVHQEADWSEERAVLNGECRSVELRRLCFERGAPGNTGRSLMVLQLVEGETVSVESPSKAFAPLTLRRGQTSIVPAAVGEFVLRAKARCIILKAAIQTGTKSYFRNG